MLTTRIYESGGSHQGVVVAVLNDFNYFVRSSNNEE